MWQVNVPNHVKVAVTRFPRSDADLIFEALRAMRDDPLGGDVYALGGDSYYRVAAGYLILFDLLPERARPERHRYRAAALKSDHIRRALSPEGGSSAQG